MRIFLIVLAIFFAHPAVDVLAQANFTGSTIVPLENSVRVLGFTMTNKDGHYKGSFVQNPAAPGYLLKKAKVANYLPNFFEMDGNGVNPGFETGHSVAVWFQVFSPYGGGTAWVDDVKVLVNGQGNSLVPEHPADWEGYDHEGGKLCVVEDASCESQSEEGDPATWSMDYEMHAPGSSGSLKVTLKGSGLDSHAWPMNTPPDVGYQLGWVCLNDVPAGILEAYASVRTQGNIQIRIGLDYRKHKTADCSDNVSIKDKTVNGPIISNAEYWTILPVSKE